MDICTFWYSGELRCVDRICLGSMVATCSQSSQKVKLFSYEPINNLPQGVELCDAHSILPKEFILRLHKDFDQLDSKRKRLVITQFSDFFRIILMHKKKGAWLDTDTYLYKAFNPDPHKTWLAKESSSRVGVSALYIPSGSPIIAEFLDYINSDRILPNWLGFKRRVLKPIKYKLTGKTIYPLDIGITVFGNDGISRLAKKHGVFSLAHPKNSFYYWTMRQSANIYDPTYGLAPLEDRNFMGFHIHRKQLSNVLPPKGSFYHWCVKRVAEFYQQDINDFFKDK